MKNIIVDKFSEDHKFVRRRSIPNGHDCWGNYEFYDEFYVFIGKGLKWKEERVYEGKFLIHNNEEILAVAYDWNLDRILEELKQKEANKKQYKLKL